MRDISLPYIFNLALALDGLNRLPVEGARFGEVYLPIVSAYTALVGLNAPDTIYGSHLRSSLRSAGALFNLLQPIVQRQDLGEEITAAQFFDIKRLYSDYKIALLAELDSLKAYSVTKKGPFDTWSLLHDGEMLFPDELAAKAPDARFDIREAAKCLAYEMPTACGFHAFRAMETVLRRYYSHVTGSKALPKTRNLGVYINALERAGADGKLVAALRQIKDLHRNPLIHPETVLTTEEAITMLGLARGAVSMMIATLPPVPPTTISPPPSLPP